MMKCDVCGYTEPCPICSGSSPIIPNKKYELWIDVYQGNDGQDWKVLKENGVDGVCCKIGYGWTMPKLNGSKKDSKFLDFVKAAQDAGLKTAGYWWIDPYEEWQRQADTCLEQIRDMGILWYASDLEQQVSWKSVYDRKRDKYIWKQVTIDGSSNSGAAKFVCDAVRKELNIPTYLYTRTQFIINNAPQVLTWLKDYGYWVVSMPREPVITYDKYEAVSKRYIYCPTWEEWYEKYALKPENDKFKPLLPKNIDWKIWQFSIDKVKLPGSKSYMDLNWLKT